VKVLRMRSWNFHADNLDQMAKFYEEALGAEITAQQTIAGVKVLRLCAGVTITSDALLRFPIYLRSVTLTLQSMFVTTGAAPVKIQQLAISPPILTCGISRTLFF